MFLEFSDITGCLIDIEEDCTGLMREDKDGKEVSYVPKRFEYRYDFYLTIQVRNPYFDEIRFRANPSSVESGTVMGRPQLERIQKYQQYQWMCEEIKKTLLESRERVRNEQLEANAPKQSKICQCCGATTLPDENGCCEYCGGAIGG